MKNCKAKRLQKTTSGWSTSSECQRYPNPGWSTLQECQAELLSGWVVSIAGMIPSELNERWPTSTEWYNHHNNNKVVSIIGTGGQHDKNEWSQCAGLYRK